MSPLIIGVILIISWGSHEPLTKGDYQYPGWADSIGWLISMTVILAVPVVAIYQLGYVFYKNPTHDFHFPTIWTELTQPTETWRENAKKANLIEPVNGNDVEMKEGYDNPAANLE